MRRLATRGNQKGFTIVELMISMAVLSVLLVVVSAAMINIGSLYYKGMNQAKVQNSVRSISDEIGGHLQLMGGNSGVGPFELDPLTIDGQSFNSYVVCTGDTRYTYVLGVQQGNNSTVANPQIAHVLWRDKQSGSCTDDVPDLSRSDLNNGGVELVPNGARLTELGITSAGIGAYNVRIGIAYGENDLFVEQPVVGANVRCAGTQNTKFCASAYLDTKVVRRL